MEHIDSDLKIKKSFVLLAILIVSLSMNLLFLVRWAEKAQEMPLTGTFCSESKNSIGGGVYFAVTSDGEYTLYRQFQLLKTGHCEQEGNMLYSDAQAIGYYNRRDTVALFLEEAACVLSRTDTIPNYINVPGMMNE